jgi:hypothetical protein
MAKVWKVDDFCYTKIKGELYRAKVIEASEPKPLTGVQGLQIVVSPTANWTYRNSTEVYELLSEVVKDSWPTEEEKLLLGGKVVEVPHPLRRGDQVAVYFRKDDVWCQFSLIGKVLYYRKTEKAYGVEFDHLRSPVRFQVPECRVFPTGILTDRRT